MIFLKSNMQSAQRAFQGRRVPFIPNKVIGDGERQLICRASTGDTLMTVTGPACIHNQGLCA